MKRSPRRVPLGALWWVALLLAVATTAAPAQILPAASGTAALQHVLALSQQIGPRVTGSSADARAADYMAEQLRRFGYAVERQAFPIVFFDEASPPALTVIGSAQAGVPAVALIYSAPTSADGLEAEVVPAGLGRDEDLRGRRLDGKIALIERGQVFFRVKVANAAAAGAAAVIVYNDRPGPAQPGTLVEPSAIPAVMISQDDGQRLLQLTRAGPVRIRLQVRTIVERRTSHNVIGIKRGTRVPSEIVVVGGHADSVKGSPGANDNASGIAAMLEAARVLAGVPTARTIHFIGFGAEEIGLVGSSFYVRNRSGTVVGIVNMDMVGRGPGLMIGNTRGEGPLVDLAERVARRLGLRVARIREDRSDHLPFEQAGIPAVFLHTGDDETLHTPNDIAERVSPQLLEQAAALAAGIALDLANPDR